MTSLFVPIAPFIGTVLQFVTSLLSRDRRVMILDRRAKVLSLAKELKAAGLTTRDLRLLKRRLTRED